MSSIPEELKYASTHEWVSVDDDGLVTVGISDHAQGALGDIVFVELPEPGTSVNAKEVDRRFERRNVPRRLATELVLHH